MNASAAIPLAEDRGILSDAIINEGLHSLENVLSPQLALGQNGRPWPKLYPYRRSVHSSGSYNYLTMMVTFIRSWYTSFSSSFIWNLSSHPNDALLLPEPCILFVFVLSWAILQHLYCVNVFALWVWTMTLEYMLKKGRCVAKVYIGWATDF